MQMRQHEEILRERAGRVHVKNVGICKEVVEGILELVWRVSFFFAVLSVL